MTVAQLKVKWLCIDLCSNKWLLSGSLDATVKLWSIVCADTADSLLSARPLAEFFHDCGVLCVAIDERGGLGASGTEDGVVTLFDLASKSVLFSCQPGSNSKRYALVSSR